MVNAIAALLARLSLPLGHDPTPHPQLSGQSCDRLRPSFLRRRLEQVLPLHTEAGAALVDWRWDCVAQRVSGVVLQNNQLRPFRWWPSRNHFELRGAILQIGPLGRRPGPAANS